jgi:hypothetical protein
LIERLPQVVFDENGQIDYFISLDDQKFKRRRSELPYRDRFLTPLDGEEFYKQLLLKSYPLRVDSSSKPNSFFHKDNEEDSYQMECFLRGVINDPDLDVDATTVLRDAKQRGFSLQVSQNSIDSTGSRKSLSYRKYSLKHNFVKNLRSIFRVSLGIFIGMYLPKYFPANFSHFSETNLEIISRNSFEAEKCSFKKMS